MKRLGLLCLAAALALTPLAAKADTVINLNATPPAAATPGTTNYYYTTTLGPGTYSVKVIGTADGGQYNGWNPYTPSTSAGWGERVGFNLTGATFGYSGGYPSYTYPNSDANLFGTNSYADAMTALTAAKAAGAYTFTLATSQQVTFYIPDQPNGAFPGFSDNTGGVSLSLGQVAPTPEPSSLVLLGTGLLGVAGEVRRRFKA